MRHALLAVLACSVACGEGSPAAKPFASGGTSSMAGAGGNGGAGAAGGGTDGGGAAGSAGQAGSSGGAGAGGAPVLGATDGYQAEDAFHAGTAAFVASTTDVSGAGYVDALATPGARLIFAVNVAADGPSAVRLRFKNPGDAKNVTLFVNGSNVATTTLAKAPSFVEHQQMLTLRSGLNTIAFVNAGAGSTPISIDQLTLQNGAPRPARGATVPFVEYEAEAGTLGGASTGIGPETLVGTLAANASGRRAVTLAALGDSVEWTTTAAASGLVLRYSLPDAASGGGIDSSVSLYVDGQKREDLPLSSRDAWVYDPYPFNNDPASGVASRPFSEARFTIADVAAGAKLRLQLDTSAPPITLDLIDLEPIPPPYVQPPGSVSIVTQGAIADDEGDDSAAFTAAIASAKATSRVVWIPPGHFVLGSRVDVDHVTVRGAGPWHSVLHGQQNRGGFNGTGDAVQLLDFAFFGAQDHRDDSFDSAVDGKLGQESLILNLWIQSSKVGIWLVDTSGAYVVGSRIRDTYADGVNLNTNVTYTAVEHLHVRSTGDDGMAIWSKGNSGHNRFKLDTVHVPYHASAIAVYGGDSHHVEDCVVADTVRNGAGIHVGTRHDPIPFAGTTVIARNTLSRTSSLDVPNQGCFGALWLFADTKDMDAPLLLQDLRIGESACNAIYFTGSHAVKQVQLSNIAVQTAGGAGLAIETPGSGSFDGVTLTGAATPATVPPAFIATKGVGNVGW